MLRRFKWILAVLVAWFVTPTLPVLAQATPPTTSAEEAHPAGPHSHGPDGEPVMDGANSNAESNRLSSLLAPDRSTNMDIQDDPEILKRLVSELPEEIQPEAQAAWDRYEELNAQIAEAMGKLRSTQLRYRNDLDRTPAAIKRFREERDAVWALMNEEFTAALEMIRYLPSSEAASYLVTMLQYRFDSDIYDAESFEAAARLLDLGQNLRFLYLIGARSAVVEGKFESAKQVYDALKEEDMEKTDLALKYQLDVLEKQYDEEQAAIEAADPESLPQVRFETTMGSFLVELFPDTAPSAVAHFLKLVDEGFYDGMDWSVVTQSVLALTGDVTGDGRGNSGDFLIDEHEREDARNALRGSLIMAKIPLEKGEFVPNSGSSQFAVAYLPIPAVREEQTIFGRVIEGMDVVSRLRRVDPTKEKKKNEVQLPPDSIISSEIVRPGKDLPEPKYLDLQEMMDEAVKAGLLRPKAAPAP
ncbi:peptidylprolyl isomerase [Neorhodopirellula lusitana]|uniref:peptidylprolyl isomerase n=1 Tax=Neorhodopirellula lusitana TaxID=445327 RepID=UPI00384EF902